MENRWTKEKIESFKRAASIVLASFSMMENIHFLFPPYKTIPLPEPLRPHKKFWENILNELNKSEPNFALIETMIAAQTNELVNNPSPN